MFQSQIVNHSVSTLAKFPNHSDRWLQATQLPQHRPNCQQPCRLSPVPFSMRLNRTLAYTLLCSGWAKHRSLLNLSAKASSRSRPSIQTQAKRQTSAKSHICAETWQTRLPHYTFVLVIGPVTVFTTKILNTPFRTLAFALAFQWTTLYSPLISRLWK